MDFKDLQNKSKKELHGLLNDQRASLQNFRFEASENQLKNVSKINNTKKTIARILTILNAKKV